MSQFRVRQAAALLGISDDTLRRWAEQGRVATATDDAGRVTIAGTELARLAQDVAAEAETLPAASIVGHSVRNRFTGLVTRVVRDTVMAQVEIQSGPHRFVSLLSREAADELGLEPGVLAVAAIKSTNVSVEIPGGSRS
ncbi:MAG: helix-turn-helix domain-containing protein [Actinomycetota bacterium]|nr:MAG: helix-turn-helix domain-containing protein [Actinomycetota bacterium]